MITSDMVVGQYWQYEHTRTHTNFIFYIDEVNYKTNMIYCKVLYGINNAHLAIGTLKVANIGDIFYLHCNYNYNSTSYIYLGNNKAIVEALYG